MCHLIYKKKNNSQMLNKVIIIIIIIINDFKDKKCNINSQSAICH